MTIKEAMVVSVNYKLSNHTTGEKIEETTVENPMVFLYGVGGLIPEFEENIFGKKAGDAFDFAIKAENAYGVAAEDNIVMIPLNIFADEQGKFDTEYFKVGATVPMSDNEGNRLLGTIREVTEEFIKMDFNHPLSGIDLHFSGEIVEVREATADELDHGHAHGPGGHHH